MKRNLYLFIGIILVVLGVIWLINVFIPVSQSKYKKEENELTTLTAYLINDPKYTRDGGRNSSQVLRLELDEIVGVFFDNDGAFLDATDWKAVLKEIKYHDTVTIKVDRSEFERFYIKKSDLTQFQRFIHAPIDRFRFYSLKFKGKEYVHDIYESAERVRKESMLITILLCVAIIFFGITIIIKKI
jgi:hypothetical protein